MDGKPCPCCGHDDVAVNLAIKDILEQNETLRAERSAHAAEVERLTVERDALKAELDIQSPHRIRLYNDLLGSQALVDEVVSERDAAVARAEKAEAIIYDEAMDHRAHGFCDCPLCEFADAIAAAPDHISQPGKKVEYTALAPELCGWPDGEK